MKRTKGRFRQGIVIGIEELRDRYMSMEMVSTLLCMSTYIGYIDIWSDSARLYVFNSAEGAEEALREAKKIGFRTAGCVDGPVYLSNSDLSRPHLNRLKGYDFQREYYK